MQDTAFESITTRVAWYVDSTCTEGIAKYKAVEFNASGNLVPATGAGAFAGIVQYGTDKPDTMVTAVRGVFPGIASGDVAVGSKLTVNNGNFKEAGSDDVVFGTALSNGADGELVSVFISDVTTPAPASEGGSPPTPVAVTGVSLNKATLTLVIGATEDLVATVAPEDAANKTVTWSSSDTDKATVSSAGKVEGVGEGQATITVTTTDGSKTATCIVTVST